MIESLIEINIYCCLLVLIYFGLRNFLKSKIRRNFLRLIPIVAICIFILKFLLQSQLVSMSIPVIELSLISVGDAIQNEASSSYSYLSLTNLYWLGAILFLGYSFYKVFLALSNFKNRKYVNTEKIWLSSTDHPQSFTFLNRIHLSNQLEVNDKSIVLEHELWHVKFKHSWDLLLIELCHAFFWFNPILFILKKELICVHEYQVDQEMYQKHDKTYLKHLLASSLGVNSSQILLTSQFYNGLSLTQRKKQMKTKIKNNWVVLAMIPLFALALVFVSFTSNQSAIPMAEVVEQDSVHKFVDKMPEFIGGQPAMIDYIGGNVKYPEEAKKEGIEGTVYIMLTVKSDGSIADVRSMKAVNNLLEAEAVRVIKSMPNWLPGIKDKKKVSTQMTIPIKFKLP